MTKPYYKIINDIDRLLGNKKITTEEALDAMKNIRDHAEFWIEALGGDLRDKGVGEC